MQVVRKQPKVFGDADGAVLDYCQRLLDLWILNLSAATLEMSEKDRDARNVLAHVVVEIARDAGTLQLPAR